MIFKSSNWTSPVSQNPGLSLNLKFVPYLFFLQSQHRKGEENIGGGREGKPEGNMIGIDVDREIPVFPSLLWALSIHVTHAYMLHSMQSASSPWSREGKPWGCPNYSATTVLSLSSDSCEALVIPQEAESLQREGFRLFSLVCYHPTAWTRSFWKENPNFVTLCENPTLLQGEEGTLLCPRAPLQCQINQGVRFSFDF